MSSPRAIIIAGPNGAGKTTFAREFLPREGSCLTFINADLIAAGLAPFAPATAAIQAAKLMSQAIGEAVEARRDFAVETTLAGRGYLSAIRTWQAMGYHVGLFFLRLTSGACAPARHRRCAARLLRRSPLRGDRSGASPASPGRCAARNQAPSPLAHAGALGGLLFAGFYPATPRQGLAGPGPAQSTEILGQKLIRQVMSLKIKDSKVELAIARVRLRVIQGGHDIPEEVIRRRFDRGFRHFEQDYRPLVDAWRLFDASSASPVEIASGVTS